MWTSLKTYNLPTQAPPPPSASGLALSHSVRCRPEISTLLPKPETTHREPAQPTGCSEGGSCPGLLSHFRSHSGKVRLAASTQKLRTQSTAQGNELGTEASRIPQPFRDPRNDQRGVRPDHLDFHFAPTNMTAAIASKMVPRRPWLTFQAGVQACFKSPVQWAMAWMGDLGAALGTLWLSHRPVPAGGPVITCYAHGSYPPRDRKKLRQPWLPIHSCCAVCWVLSPDPCSGQGRGCSTPQSRASSRRSCPREQPLVTHGGWGMSCAVS